MHQPDSGKDRPCARIDMIIVGIGHAAEAMDRVLARVAGVEPSRAGHDSTLIRGDPKAGRVTALDCANQVKDYVQERKLVEHGARIPPLQLVADKAIELKSLMTI